MPSQTILKFITIGLAIVLVGLLLSTLGKKSGPQITAPNSAPPTTSLPPPAMSPRDEIGKKSAPEITEPISPVPTTPLPPVNPAPTAPPRTEIAKKSDPEITAPIAPPRSTPLRPVVPPPIAPSRSPSLDTPVPGTFMVYSRGNRLTEGIRFSEMDEKFGLNSPGDIAWEFNTPPAKLPEGATLKWYLDRKLRGYPMPLTSKMLKGMQTYPDMPEPGVWEIRLGRPGEKDLLLFTFTILKEEKGAQR